MQEKYSLQIDHIGRIYEAAKDGVFKKDDKAALDGLQELRNIACTDIRDMSILEGEVERLTKAVEDTRSQLMDAFGLFGGGEKLNKIFDHLNKAIGEKEGEEDV